MVMKKVQQEEKAKGLIGLKKGKKIAGAPYSVGNYKRKSLNLKDKQLGAAGRKAAAVRGGVKVPISSTRYDTTTKKVYGPAGRLLTGRVDLGGGNIGVYRNGVRVTAKKVASPRKISSNNNNNNNNNNSNNDGVLTAAQKAARQADATRNRRDAGWPGKPQPDRKRGGYVGGRTYMPSPSQSNNVPGRVTDQVKSEKPIYYANGTANVYDPALKKRVTVSKNDRRHPKYKK